MQRDDCRSAYLVESATYARPLQLDAVIRSTSLEEGQYDKGDGSQDSRWVDSSCDEPLREPTKGRPSSSLRRLLSPLGGLGRIAHAGLGRIPLLVQVSKPAGGTLSSLRAIRRS